MKFAVELDVHHHHQTDAEILRSHPALVTKGDLKLMELRIMATLDEIKSAIADEGAEVKTKVDALQTEVQALKDQIAAGGTVSAADLDEVLAGIKGIFTPA